MWRSTPGQPLDRDHGCARDDLREIAPEIEQGHASGVG